MAKAITSATMTNPNKVLSHFDGSKDVHSPSHYQNLTNLYSFEKVAGIVEKVKDLTLIKESGPVYTLIYKKVELLKTQNINHVLKKITPITGQVYIAEKVPEEDKIRVLESTLACLTEDEQGNEVEWVGSVNDLTIEANNYLNASGLAPILTHRGMGRLLSKFSNTLAEEYTIRRSKPPIKGSVRTRRILTITRGRDMLELSSCPNCRKLMAKIEELEAEAIKTRRSRRSAQSMASKWKTRALQAEAELKK